jgi:DNA-directed RNA polymerase specialized sigma24 family protein
VDAENSSLSSAAEDFERCLNAARAGSLEALSRLLDRYRPYLPGIANDELETELRPRAGPSDIVQESFLEASGDFAKFRGQHQEELLAWLRGIVRNNVADFRRRHWEAACRRLDRELTLEADEAVRLNAETPGPLAFRSSGIVARLPRSRPVAQDRSPLKDAWGEQFYKFHSQAMDERPER